MRGAWLHGLQFKAEGQETLIVRNTHREVTYLQLGNPAICVCVCVAVAVCVAV